MSPSIRQIPRTNAAEAVREQLLALIEAGEFSVGSRLPSENELAKSFGVSRPVVREGLGALRAAGVLESRSGAGTFVLSARPTKPGLLLLGRYSAEDLHEVRTHLEVPGAGLAATRRSDADLERLEQIVARHSGVADAVEWVEHDLEFHVALAEATGNELQARLVQDLRGLQFEQTVLMARVTGGVAAPDAEHRAILDAVRRQDRELAEQAMAAHLAAILERFKALTDGSGADETEA
jgi:DNA-binding FadR family transcriptional regulator